MYGNHELREQTVNRSLPHQLLATFVVCSALSVCSGFVSVARAKMPTERVFTNSIGMKFVRIEPGGFVMGFENATLTAEVVTGRGQFVQGDFDEHPRHRVKISRPYYIGMYEVTNAQYGRFAPEHRRTRGKEGASKGDDEAVNFVSWNDAAAFCKWLSKKEGMAYRLCTEAEWEYACRAGTTTAYHTGLTLPQIFSEKGRSLAVGRTPANAWGVYDMHGGVEEWCYDWYGPYEAGEQIDPVGRISGDFKVTRGGSNGTEAYYLRSANRLGTLPDDKHGLIGFRVVLGEMPDTRPLPEPEKELHQINARQKIPTDIAAGPDPDRPYFHPPRKFVKMPAGDRGPLFAKHSHFMSVVECPNGDLLAIWHSCISESGRELCVAASRLHYGLKSWEPASLFWDAPDRNDHGHALWFDGKDTIYHFQGLADQVRNVALVLRTSKDNCVTWSRPRVIAEHGPSRMPIESVFRAQDGSIVTICDKGPTVLWISGDEGQSWYKSEGTIRGKHATVAQLSDGRLFAFGRERNIDGMMPISISADMGKTWKYSASEFQPVCWGQRSVLLRLREGPLFFASFCKRMKVTNAAGKQHLVSGLFGSVSFDDGKTWPYKRLITDDGPPRSIETMNGHLITMSPHNSVSVAYLTVCQSADGVIHLLGSRQHYAFNLKWLMTPPPEAPFEPPLPKARRLAVRKELPFVYDSKKLYERAGERNSQTMSLSPEGLVKIDTVGKGDCSLGLVDDDGIDAVSDIKGLSVEFKSQVLKTAGGRRGIDLEIYDGGCGRYGLTIKENAIYWYEGLILGTTSLAFDQFTTVADGLDNADAMHTYRISVRPDRVAQIYRDGELVGLRNYEYRTPRDAYIKFGAAAGAEALIEYVALDLTGPSQPE